MKNKLRILDLVNFDDKTRHGVIIRKRPKNDKKEIQQYVVLDPDEKEWICKEHELELDERITWEIKV